MVDDQLFLQTHLLLFKEHTVLRLYKKMFLWPHHIPHREKNVLIINTNHDMRS